MFLFYVLSFFKKGDTIQGGTLFKEIQYLICGANMIVKDNLAKKYYCLRK